MITILKWGSQQLKNMRCLNIEIYNCRELFINIFIIKKMKKN